VGQLLTELRNYLPCELQFVFYHGRTIVTDAITVRLTCWRWLGCQVASMPPKKRQRVPEQSGVSDERTSSISVVSSENPSNVEKGLLKFPIELREEVLHHFEGVNIYTKAPSHNPILPVKYLEWTDALRVLSQVCVAYRRAFLPRLWESFTACIDSGSGDNVQFFAHAGNTLARKCEGLSNNPELAEHVR